MVDAHCHLQDIPNFDVSSLDLVICAGASIESSHQAIEIASKHSNVYATVGIHPESNDNFDEIIKMTKSPKVVAIGECGLDSDNPREIELLKLHVDLARELDFPLVIHNRHQDQKILEILADYPKVMIHCFTSDKSFADECIKRGWYMSFSGILTFKKSDYLREIAKLVPENLLLTETDAPYLSPKPSNAKIIAQLLANLRNTSIDQIEAITLANCKRLFKI